MSNKARNTSGKFAPKSETPRKIRSVNLTDDAWQWLASVAEAVGMSRNDFLESLASGSYPFMEAVGTDDKTLVAPVYPLMETVGTETEVVPTDIEQQPDINVHPLIETVSSDSDIETLKQELRSASRQLEAQDKELLQLHERNGDLGLEVQNLREELAAVTRDRDEIKNSTPIAIGIEFPEAADLLNQLKARRKKSKADLADVGAILEMIEKSTISVGD